MPHIWVTGANGFIGRHLVRHLAGQGHRVSGIGHGVIGDEERSALGLASWEEGALSAPLLDRLADAAGTPDAVFHLAGGSSVGASIADPRRDFERTVAATEGLLEWLSSNAIQASLVAISSAAVYGAGQDGPIPVDADVQPFSPYGAHKQAMEDLCRSHGERSGLDIAIVRLFSVYGPGLRKQLLWDLCRRLAAGERPVVLGGTGHELRDWTDVRDVVRLLDRLAGLSDATVPVFNGGTGTGTSIRAIATRVAASWGLAPDAIVFSGECREGDPFSLVAEAGSPAEAEFDWRISLRRGIGDYVAWFRAQWERGRP